jgi:hypothetical protein
MFGLNDDDKHRAHQPYADQNSQDTSGDDGSSQSSDHASPFAAAYSSLNGGDNSSGSHPTAPMVDNSIPEEDLLQLKTQALQSLAPLVGHLDQSPEEKFKTTMMVIQASDNAELIRDAYAAANQIEDEKIRAQALLDVINEINYFTQRNKS